MPSLQEIQQFKDVLNQLGDEPAILAERGEAIEEVPPPEEGLPEGLSDLLDTGETVEVPLSGFFEAEEPAAFEFPEEPAEQIPAPAELGPGGEEEVDLAELLGIGKVEGADDLGDLGASQPEEPVEIGEGPEVAEALEAPGAPEAAEEAEAPEAAETVDEFAIPEGLLGPAPEEEGPEEPFPEMPTEAAETEAPFELPEEFTLPELAEEQGPPPETGEEAAEAGAFELPDIETPREAVEEAGEPAGLGEFELPDEFQLSEEDLGFAEAAGPEEQAPAPAGEAAGEPSAEEAEFLRALEQDIFPGVEPTPGPQVEGEAGGALDLEQPFGEEPPGEAPEEPPFGEEPPPQGEEPSFAAEEAPGAEAAFPEESFPAEELEAGGEQVDLEAAHPGAAEEFPLDEFPLEDFGQAFGVEEGPTEEAAAGELPPELRAEPSEGPPEVPEGPAPVGEAERPEALPEGTLRLSDRQFEAFKGSLALLPRNLKIAIEELIAEKGLTGAELRRVVELLVRGAAPAAIAEQVSRISGRRIVLPKSYARLSGLAFEAERRTFAYAFRENIWPILRVAVLGLAFVGLLGFLGYRYVYKPLYANVLYRQGYSQIQKERYRLANERFDKATGVWVFKNWFYRYADAFAGKRQFELAGQKYEQLLERYPNERRGILAYASLLTNHLAGYEKAEALLQGLLQRNVKDYEALLAQGDNSLQWAESDADAGAGRLESARFSYASIIDYYGERDEVLMRMMRYFIRLDRMSGQDKLAETRKLKEYLDSRRHLRVAPELLASVYAELGGYWIDKRQLDQVPGVLFKAMDARMEVPEIHYQLARYYRAVREPGEEEKALEAAITLLERTQPLDKKQLFLLIDSYNRRGETYYRRQEYLDAEKFFGKAITEIEQAQGRRVFGMQPEFGLAYKNQGDLYYYVSRDPVAALDLYQKAAANRYESPDLDYKMGYVHYGEGRYEQALLAFSKVVDQRPVNENALFALANALYHGGYYSSAQGYYLRLLEILEGRVERIRFLQVFENPEHRALVEHLMKVYNNLGVTLRNLGQRSLDPDKESKALVNLTFSSERFDLISRDPETAARGLTQNLAYLNQRGILYPQSGFQLQIYTRLPLDLEALNF